MSSIKTAKEIIKAGRISKVPIWIWGAHGNGKSDIVRQVAKEEGISCIDIRAALTEAGDWMGLPYISPEDYEMHFADSPFLPRKDETNGILFLDELNRARQDVMNCVFQLALDRRIGKHYKLPEGWSIVVAANPGDSDYQVTDVDPALLGRFCHVKLTPTTDEFLSYARKVTMRDEIRSFIADNKKLLGNSHEDFRLENVKPNPRSWEMYSKMIYALEQMNVLDDYIIEVGAGLVGAEAAGLFTAYRKNKFKRIDAAMILDSYDKIRKDVEVMVKEGRLDVQAIEDLLTSKDFKEDEIVKSKKKFHNLMLFLNDIAADVAYTGIRTITEKYTKLVNKIATTDDDAEAKKLYERMISLDDA
jgi:MoxR-like ATPase